MIIWINFNKKRPLFRFLNTSVHIAASWTLMEPVLIIISSVLKVFFSPCLQSAFPSQFFECCHFKVIKMIHIVSNYFRLGKIISIIYWRKRTILLPIFFTFEDYQTSQQKCSYFRNFVLLDYLTAVNTSKHILDHVVRYFFYWKGIQKGYCFINCFIKKGNLFLRMDNLLLSPHRESVFSVFKNSVVGDGLMHVVMV